MNNFVEIMMLESDDRVAYLQKYDDFKVYFEDKLGVVVTFLNPEGKPRMVAWAGRSKKPASNYVYRSIKARDDAAEEFVNNLKSHAANKKQQKEREKLAKEKLKETLNVGDILFSWWGHEQTNLDYYQIVGIKGNTVELKALKTKEVRTTQGGMGGDLMPLKDKFINDNIIKGRVGAYGVKIDSYRSASLWDGKPKYYTSYA